jgi:integrase
MKLKLTDARVKALKCKEGSLLEVRDSAVSGLEIRVTRSGAKSWRLHYTRRSDGKRRAVALGPYPSLSLKAARRKAKGLQSEIEDNEARGDPATGVRARRGAHTFDQLANDWKERHGRPNKTPRAFRDDELMLARHILPEIGSMKASEITKRNIIRLLDTVVEKPDARSLVKPRKLTHRPNRVFALVRSIFRWAVGRDIIKSDPMLGLSPPIKKEKPRERDLTFEEMRTLWGALENAPLIRPAKGQAGDFPMTYATALTLKLSLVTAQRIGEVTGIAQSELSLKDGEPMWIVPGSRTKNGRPNRVPLSRIALGLIAEAQELANGSPWLFPNPKNDGPIDSHAPTRALARARPAIGIPDFRIHDLRRTAATRMAEIDVSPHTISLVLNHVSATQGTVTGKAYVQYQYDREKRAALDAWGVRLGAIVAS